MTPGKPTGGLAAAIYWLGRRRPRVPDPTPPTKPAKPAK